MAANPQGTLLLGYDGNLYGTTTSGGSAGAGTLFQLTTTGTETILHNFNDNSVPHDGTSPQTALIQGSDGNIYGVTPTGGTSGDGTVFAVVASQNSGQRPVFFGASSVSVPVYAPLSFTPKALFGTGNGGASPSFVQQITAFVSGLFQPALGISNWTLDPQAPTTGLPNYMTFNPTSGTISGTGTQTGTFTFTFTPHNAIGSGAGQPFTLYIGVPPTITSANTAGGNQQSAFNYSVTATADPFAFSGTDLPGWLSINTATGQLTGTPPDPGLYVFNIVASNASGSGLQQVQLTATGGGANYPAVTSPDSATVAAGEPFSFQLAATNNPTSFSALILPVGLLFNPTTGLISGVPTTPGTYSVPISVTDSAGTTASEVTFTIDEPVAPSFTGTLTAHGYTNRAFSYQVPATGLVSIYDASGLPTGLSISPSTGVIAGTVTTSGTYTAFVSASNGYGHRYGHAQPDFCPPRAAKLQLVDRPISWLHRYQSNRHSRKGRRAQLAKVLLRYQPHYASQ